MSSSEVGSDPPLPPIVKGGHRGGVAMAEGEPYLRSVLRILLCSFGFPLSGLAPCRTLTLGLEGAVASAPFLQTLLLWGDPQGWSGDWDGEG